MIIYKTLNSNISATTQYNDFVWGDEWGNIWGVGYSTGMSTIMTRAKPILSQTLSYITTKRATDKKISATTKVYNQIKREVTRLDVIFKLGIPKNIIFNLTENQDIAFTLTQGNDVTIQADDITDLIYDSKLDKYTK